MLRGALVNDYLSMLGEKTFWHTLLHALPGLEDWTGVDFSELPYQTENRFFDMSDEGEAPQYIIRNASYFPALRLPVPQISLLQDIFPVGFGRDMQREVFQSCETVVTNSAYTAFHYPEIASKIAVVPIPVDPQRFLVRDCVRPVDQRTRVCWVGSSNLVKGIEILQTIVETTPYEFVIVSKDEVPILHERVVGCSTVSQERLADLMLSCDVGLCTSLRETQHLAGVEMGYTGMPIVTTNVGTYYNRAAGMWGSSGSEETIVERLHAAIHQESNPRQIRNYWLDEFGPLRALARWQNIIDVSILAYQQKLL